MHHTQKNVTNLLVCPKYCIISNENCDMKTYLTEDEHLACCNDEHLTRTTVWM